MYMGDALGLARAILSNMDDPVVVIEKNKHIGIKVRVWERVHVEDILKNMDCVPEVEAK